MTIIEALRGVIGSPPAGYEKYEYIGALVILIIIMYSCTKILKWIKS